MAIKRHLSGGGGGGDGSDTGGSTGTSGGGGGVDLPASIRRQLRDAGAEADEDLKDTQTTTKTEESATETDTTTTDDAAPRAAQRAVEQTQDTPDPARGKQRAVDATTRDQDSTESTTRSDVTDAIAEANTSTAEQTGRAKTEPDPSPDPDPNETSPMDRVESAVSDAADQATETVDRATDSAEDAVDDAEQTAQDVARAGQRAVEQSADTAQDRATDAVDDAERTAQGVAETAREAAEPATSTVQNPEATQRDAVRSYGQQFERVNQRYGVEEQIDETVPEEIAGGADVLAGSTDEAVARAEADMRRGDVAGAADALAGSTDEAVGRAVADAREGDVAGVADNLAGGTDEAVSGVPQDVAGWGDFLAGSTDEAVGRTAEHLRDAETDLKRGRIDAATRDARKAGEEVRRGITTDPGETRPQFRIAAEASGVVDAAADRDPGRVTQETSDLAETIRQEKETAIQRASDAITDAGGPATQRDAAVQTRRTKRGAEPDPDAVNLTDNGFLTEEDEGKLKTASRYVNRQIEGAGQTVKEGATKAAGEFGEGAVITPLYGEPARDEREQILEEQSERRVGRPAGSFAKGYVQTVAGTGNVFGIAQSAETSGEVATNLDEAEREGKGNQVKEKAIATGRDTSKRAVEAAREKPFETAGGVAAGIALSYGAGAGVEKVARGARVASRSARGRSKIDLREETNPGTLAALRSGDDSGNNPFPEESRRPGESRVEAVKRQARENTADTVEESFEEAGVEDGVVMKHVTGGGKLKGESRLKRTVETDREIKRRDDPKGGLFTSPEASLYFVRNSEDSFSLRPRLPGTGKPARQLSIKTDVDRMPDRVGPEGTGEPGPESRFLAEREGETTAYLRSEANRNPGEVEAIVPPGAKFKRVDTPGYKRYKGDVIDVEAYKPVDPDADADGGPTTTATDGGSAASTDDADVFTYEELRSRSRSYRPDEGQPAAPVPPSASTGAGTRSTTTGSGSTTSLDASDPSFRGTADETAALRDRLGSIKRRQRDSGTTSSSTSAGSDPADDLDPISIRRPDRPTDRDSGSGASDGSADASDPIDISPPRSPGDGDSGRDDGSSGSDGSDGIIGGGSPPSGGDGSDSPGSSPGDGRGSGPGTGGSGPGSGGGSGPGSGNGSTRDPRTPPSPPVVSPPSGGDSGGGRRDGDNSGTTPVFGPPDRGPIDTPPGDGGSGGSGPGSGGGSDPRSGGGSSGPGFSGGSSSGIGSSIGGSSGSSRGPSRAAAATSGVGSILGPLTTPPERPDTGVDDRREREVQPRRPRPTGSDWLAPGWLSETVTTIGTKARGTNRIPTQQTLERQPLTGGKLAGELPTYEMLRGSEQTKESIAAVQGLFTSDARGRAEPSAQTEEERFFFGLGIGSDEDTDSKRTDDRGLLDVGGGLL